MRITINVQDEQVSVGEYRVDRQWVDFYALLALNRSDARKRDLYLTAEQLATSGPWKAKRLASVGKEVARHIADLEARNLGGIVEFRRGQRTKAWRLAENASELCWQPDRTAIENWARGRSLSDVCGDIAAVISALVEAACAVRVGDRQRARDWLKKTGDTQPPMEAWRGLLLARAAPEEDDDDLFFDRLQRDWSLRKDAAGRSVAARIKTIAEYRRRGVDAEATQTTLGALAADLENRGDVGALAMVTNVLGLLAHNACQWGQAEALYLRAAGLAALSEDFRTLQGALFNIAHARRERLRREGRVADETVISLLRSCLKICEEFGVGNDELQAEANAAVWAAEAGHFDSARSFLQQAESLLGKIQATGEQAVFYWARARVALEVGGGKADRSVIGDLERAADAFERAGDGSKADACRLEAKALRASPAPSQSR